MGSPDSGVVRAAAFAYRTPTNSIFVTSGLIAALLVFASLGVHAAEAFQVLNNARRSCIHWPIW